MTTLTLGYWKVREMGQHLRLLLAYSTLPFVETQYESKEQWLADRDNLDLSFPNMSYLLDGHLRLTESTAIAKYIAKRVGKS